MGNQPVFGDVRLFAGGVAPVPHNPIGPPEDDGEEVFNAAAELLALLACSNRLEMLYRLSEEELAVHDLADRLRITQANASVHLRHLRQSGLVARERHGCSVLYRINERRINRTFVRELCEIACHERMAASAADGEDSDA